MSVTLYHHPFTRAASTVWMLEEIGIPYDLHFLDVRAGAHKAPEILALNPMGKLPILVDDGHVITESAAIGLYLADRYAPGRLAPSLDDPARGTYLRWSLFGPSVIEPAAMAKSEGWQVKASAAGWGNYDDAVNAIEAAIGDRPYLLGEKFTMADILFGGTVRFMLRFKMLEARPSFVAYADRLSQRPASRKAEARNAEIAAQHGLGG